MIGWIILLIGLGVILVMLSFIFAYVNEANFEMSLVEHLTDLEFRQAWIRMTRTVLVVIGLFAFAIGCIAYGVNLLAGDA